ncbi:MAG: type II secretion system protein [Bacillota bacterium]|nr:type II secretion system protein [Bacillota bacterium]
MGRKQKMKKLFEKFWKNEKGFTLVELIVVIAILAVLAGVLSPVILNLVNNAKTSAEQANERMIKNMGQIMVTLGELPDGAYDAVADHANFAKYLDEWPKDKDGNNMLLTIASAGLTITVTH